MIIFNRDVSHYQRVVGKILIFVWQKRTSFTPNVVQETDVAAGDAQRRPGLHLESPGVFDRFSIHCVWLIHG